MNTEKIILSLPENWEGLHTPYIQSALDRCKENGGEVVLLDGTRGKYLSAESLEKTSVPCALADHFHLLAALCAGAIPCRSGI